MADLACPSARCPGPLTHQGSGVDDSGTRTDWWWCRSCGHVVTDTTVPEPYDGPSLLDLITDGGHTR